MSFERILAPVADPQHPGSAPVLASAIAHASGASVTLLHVMEPAEPSSEPEASPDEVEVSAVSREDPGPGSAPAATAQPVDPENQPGLQVRQAIGEAAELIESQLKELSVRLEAEGAPTAVAVVEGTPAEAIASMAHLGEFDLVVIESMRGSRIGKMLFGSTADEVQSQLQVPVVMLQPEDEARQDAALAPDAVIVPLDGETDSEHVIALAGDLARTLGCGIEFVHAVNSTAFVSHPAAPITTPVASAIDSQMDEAREYLEQIASKASEDGLKVRNTVEMGNPVDVIQQVASDFRNAIIVTDSSERSGILRLLFGRLPEDLVLSSSNPVMIVPRPLGPVID